MNESIFYSQFLLKYLFLITVINHSKFLGGTAWVLDNTESCADIYTETNFAGKQLKINHGGLILDLAQVYLDSPLNVWKNSSSSVKIHSSCALKVCSERYLDGTCVQITSSRNSLNLIDGKPVSSVSCTCAKSCDSAKCVQVKFGRNDCAKGFVEEGCNTCSGISVQFKPRSQGLVGSYAERGQKIKSLAVKPGCKLIANNARDFDGDDKEITGENPKYNGKIESYVCECTAEAMNQSTLETNHQIPYMPMIDVPSTAEQITAKMSGPLLNHPGLKAALISAQNGRSSKNAYILVIGMTGAGKSASINFLFDNAEIAEVGGKESVTSEIHEFRIPVPLGEFGIQNSELRVIDTPGLGDTRGLESDAQFLATLEEYLKNHEELNERIPNVILVYAKFSQNRFDGEGANFVKMLRGIDLFSKKLFNSKFSNVVVVLTHYMSDTDALAKNPWSRIQEFQHVIEDYTNFPKPIVVSVAENKADDEGLPIVNNFYRLPNRELYPRNILEKIQQLTRLGGDPIGEAIIRTGFSHPEDFKITKITKPLLPPKNSIVTRYLNILTAANYKVEETEVSKLLEKAVNESVHISTVPTDTLPYLQRILHVQNIFKKADVPKSKEEILRLLRHIRPTMINLEILEKALSIKAPILSPAVLGKSFHGLKDIRLPTNIFQFNVSKTHPSGMGYLIPDGVTSENQDMVVNAVKVFSNRNEYIKDRLAEINFGDEDVASSQVNFSATRYGYNILPKNSQLVATRNLIKFKLTENNAPLSSEFIAAVNGILPFDRHDLQSIENWKIFFTKFGTHVVGSVAMGGVVTATLKNTKSQKQQDLEASLSKLLTYADDLINGKYNVMFQNTTDYSLEFHNGEGSILSSGELTKFDFLRATKKVQDWVESLTIHPGFLESTMTLTPIIDIAKRVNSTKAIQIALATKALITTGLVYSKHPRILEQERLERERVEQEKKAAEEKRKREEEIKKEEARMAQELERARKALEEQRRIKAEELAALLRQREYEARRRAEEEERIRRQIEHNNWVRHWENERRREEERRCLKADTKILMASGVEKPIEEIQKGDYVLDMELKPTLVIAATKWYLGRQGFFGFDESTQFFTHTHLFVGENERLYAVWKEGHIQTNPLMEYENLHNMEGQFRILKFEGTVGDTAARVRPQNCTLFRESLVYPENTPVFFLTVDSPSGTYIANGFVTRHDIPDFSRWPKTTSVLVRIVTHPLVMNKLNKIQYSPEIAQKLDDLAFIVAEKLNKFILNKLNASEFCSEKDLPTQEFRLDEILEQIFNSPTLSTFAVSLYARTGKILAELFDLQNNSEISTAVCQDSIVNEALRLLKQNLN